MANNKVTSPFKVLRAYEKADGDTFFEREEMAKQLYKYVIKNRLVLIYGPPDCGKTSVVQCGLANLFDMTEWVPFFIRRCGNINHSLSQVLNSSDALMQSFVPEEVNPESIVEALTLIEKRCLRPVYLLFDQFEEILLMGSEEEIQAFISILKTILASNTTQSSRLIFILREEYLARLRFFEKAISGFSERRFRVDPLLEPEIRSVILKSCKHFNITLSKPEEQTDLIMHNIADRADITLTYLQVYFDRLWREDYIRTYPQSYTGDMMYPPLEFTTEEIKSLGNSREVIGHFLEERTEVIQKTIKEAFPLAADDTVTNMLDTFINEEGAKISIGYTWSGKFFKLSETAPRYLRELHPDLLFTAIRELEASRIIRINGYSMELPNTLLAELIFHKRPREKRRLDEISRVIKNQYEAFSTDRQHLTGKQIRTYDDFLPQLNLEKKHIEFFKKSKEYHRVFRLLKVVGFLVLPIIGALLALFYLYRLEAEEAYTLRYLSETVSPIENKSHGIRLAKYMYDQKERKSYADVIKQTFLELFKSQQIQGLFSDFTDTLTTTSIKPEDVAISDNGNFILVADQYTPDNNVFYKLYSRQGKIIDSFLGKYAYFISHTDSILLAYKENNEKDSLFPQFKEYPEKFLIYNCHKPKEGGDSFVFAGGFLLPKMDVFKHKSEYDSYKVRLTDSGYLLVPFLARNKQSSLDKKLRIYREGKIIDEMFSSSSVSISKDGKSFSTGTTRGKPAVNLYSESGKPLGSIKGIYFADFTAAGSVVYIRNETVILRSANGDTSRQYYVGQKINYAWANGKDEKFILTRSNDSLFLLNATGQAKVHRFKEKLLGANFVDQSFITLRSNITKLRKPEGVLLQRRLFSGNAVESLFIPGGVRDFKYNEQTQELFILTDSNRIQLLNSNLKVKASFQLTANDIFGISKNGSRLFYVRDNWLSVFSNNGQLIDLADFNATYNWLEHKEETGKKRQNQKDSAFSKPIRQLRKQYNLKWPNGGFL